MGKRVLRKILTPLDGSKTAETVLPYIKYLASQFDSKIEVLGVGIGNKNRRVNRLLNEYIDIAVSNLNAEKIEAEAVVIYGSAADKILNYSKQNDIDLIIMATHGRSGVKRWWMGSVAEKIISQSITPVLLIPSKKKRATQTKKITSIDQILIPLDGSNIGQAALDHIEHVARKTRAAINLIQVISTSGSMEASLLGNANWDSFFKAMRKAASDYLESLVEELKGHGISAKYDILIGNPAAEIIEYARKNKADLIAMSTHGRTGLARWVLGSTADKVLHGAGMPMWLVRPQKMKMLAK
jgi:nucleotide-binding universal stress UspA family protein